MKQPTKRFLSFLLSLIFIAGSFVVYSYFIRPLYNDAIKIRAEMLSKREFIGEQKKIIEQVEGLIKTYNAPEQLKIREQISIAIPRGIDYSEILAQVNGLSRESGLIMRKIDFSIQGNQNVTSRRSRGSEEEAGSIIKPVGSVTVKVTLEGDYQNFKALLELFESNLRIFEPKIISISPKQTKSGLTLFDYELEFITYYQTL